MADRAISELTRATSIGNSDLFVVEQATAAMAVSGETLISELATALNGRGGISIIEKTGSSGLVDTYRITYANGSTQNFNVTNGNGISSITTTRRQDNTSRWYTDVAVNYTNGTGSTFSIYDGSNGTQGRTNYFFVRYADTMPTSDSTPIYDAPTDTTQYIGIYSFMPANPSVPISAPTTATSYAWTKIKGDTGTAATITVGTVSTGPSGSQAIVENVGTENAAILNFTLPASNGGEMICNATRPAPVYAIPYLTHTSGGSTDYETHFKALLRLICQEYPNVNFGTWEGATRPGGVGFVEVTIQDTSVVDDNGLPQRAAGLFRSLADTNVYTFAMSNYSYISATK